MKKGKGWHFIFCMALCILCFMVPAVNVYGTDRDAEKEAEREVKEAQQRLQKEQNAYNEAIAEQNRREVEMAAAEKVAAQYAAMGMELPAGVWIEGNPEEKASESVPSEGKKATAKELWAQAEETGNFLGLYENAVEKKEKGSMADNALSAFLESLTITDSPLADERYHLTDITYGELKELFPINGGGFRERDPMQGYVRHVDATGVFVFQYYWSRWYEEGTVLTVRYGAVNEQGNFTSIVFDTTEEKMKYSWRRKENDSFAEKYGYDGLTDYNLGCEGLSHYLLKNKCLHVWEFMQLTGVEMDILDEKERPEDSILCRSYNTEYGEIMAFYYRDADDWQEYFAIKFEESDIYDYILAKGITGGQMRVEVKLK